VRPLLQGVEELRRGQADDIALALQRLLVRIHGVGHVNRNHQLHVHIGRRGGRFAAHLSCGLIDEGIACSGHGHGQREAANRGDGEKHRVCAHGLLRT
jgi:hypothetical protein